MKEITTITSAPRQSFVIISEEGEKITISLRFLPTQLCWFMDVETETFNVKNICLGDSLNVLDKFQNILNYGISICSIDGIPPFQIDDFESGRVKFTLLNKEEKDYMTSVLNGEAQ